MRFDLLSTHIFRSLKLELLEDNFPENSTLMFACIQ